MKARFLLIYICLVVIPKITNAQFSKEEQLVVDSLNSIIKRADVHDTIRVVSLLDLAGYYYLTDPNIAIEICKKAEKIAIQSHYLYGISESYAWLGYLVQYQGDIPSALAYYAKSLKIQEKIDDLEGQATSLNNIAYIYGEQKDYKKALEFHNRGLQIRVLLKDKNGQGQSLNNIGLIYHEQKDFQKAVPYFNKSLALFTETNNIKGIAYGYNNLGTIYQHEQQLDSALIYYKKFYEFSKKITDKQSMGYALHNIGDVLLIKNQINGSEGALAYANECMKISKELGYPKNISEAAKLKSDIFKKQGNGMAAMEMYELYELMKDSTNNESTLKAAVKQQAQYEFDKQKTLGDAAHEKEMAIEQESKAKQKIIIYAIAVGLGFVAIFLFFVINRLKVTRRQKSIIEIAHQQLEEKNKEITDSIQYAKRIQNAILPPTKVVKEYLKESFIIYKPKDIVAGDFYWLEHRDGKILFAAADCTGHGVPGAMVSVICNNGLNRSVREHGLTDPGKILDKTREIIVQEFEKSDDDVKDGMDIALCCLTGNKLEYAGANNPLWVIRKGIGAIEEIKANKQPIGKFDNPIPYNTHTLELHKGDSIYIFSDGYFDQFGGEKSKKYKPANFKRLLLSIQHESLDKQKQLVEDAFDKWKGELEQLDDVCIIGVRI